MSTLPPNSFSPYTIADLRATLFQLKTHQKTWNDVLASFARRPRMPYIGITELSDAECAATFPALLDAAEKFFDVLADIPASIQGITGAEAELDVLEKLENEYGFRAKLMIRALRYRLADKPTFGLPKEIQKRWQCQFFSSRGGCGEMRVRVAEHLIWLWEREQEKSMWNTLEKVGEGDECMDEMEEQGEHGDEENEYEDEEEEEGADEYTDEEIEEETVKEEKREEGRYQPIPRYPGWTLEDRLGEEYAFVLEPERGVPNVEWQFMIALAGTMMQQRADHETLVRELLGDIEAAGLQYLDDWPMGESCIVCYAEFNDDNRPVVFSCDHMPGIYCAKHFAEDTICEHCLTGDPQTIRPDGLANINLEDLLEHVRGPFETLSRVVESMKALDERIDDFFLSGPLETYDISVGDLIRRLDKLTLDYIEAEFGFRSAVWSSHNDGDDSDQGHGAGEEADNEDSSDGDSDDDMGKPDAFGNLLASASKQFLEKGRQAHQNASIDGEMEKTDVVVDFVTLAGKLYFEKGMKAAQEDTMDVEMGEADEPENAKSSVQVDTLSNTVKETSMSGWRVLARGSGNAPSSLQIGDSVTIVNEVSNNGWVAYARETWVGEIT